MDTVAERWAHEAVKRAKERCGQSGWTLLTSELRHALVCQQLVGILAGQESVNGDNFYKACEIVTQMGDEL